jgi:ammonium transporter, Amt family
VNPKFGGTGVWDYVANKVADFDAGAQIISQLWDIGITLVWSGTVAFVVLLVLKLTIGIRSSDEDQEVGLDLADHGEKAYSY